jgi:hypothetical protein
MNAPATVSEADGRAFMDSIDRWLEKKVAYGALIEPEYGGLGLSDKTYSRIVARFSEEWIEMQRLIIAKRLIARNPV